MLIKNAEVNGECVDVRIDGGRIAEIGQGLKASGASFDAGGHALLPGLHDHHIHLNACAAAMNSVRCGPPEVRSKAELIEALHGAGGTDMLRGVGYHQSVAGEIDRDWLDEHGPKRPLRIQHRSGRLWILNSLAMDAFEISTPKDGRLLDSDTRLRRAARFPDLKPLISKLTSYGLTGVTEVTPSNGIAEYENYIKNAVPLRLNIMGKAELSGLDAPYIGPLKLHYHDHNLPALDDLRAEIEGAHQAGRAVAAHCVTRAELMLTLAAIEEAGVHKGDRIEHAAIADEAAIEWMARLGVTVVTQPNFITERVDAYRKDVPRDDHPHLWRLRSFIEAGLNCAAGSDAPFGDPNPWAAMAAAVSRPVGFEQEAISPEAALGLYTKPADDASAPPRRVEVGELADLCLIDRSWTKARDDLAAVNVKATWIGGKQACELKPK
ncbi:MAG: amidohydrolase family protein [Maricaulaceae bacterium]